MKQRFARIVTALAFLSMFTLAHTAGESAAATSETIEPRFYSYCLSTKTVTLDIRELGDINAEFTCNVGPYRTVTIVNIHIFGTPGIGCMGGFKAHIGGAMKIEEKMVPFGDISSPDDSYAEGRQEDYPNVTLHGKSFLQTATDRQQFYFGGWRWNWTDCLIHGNSIAVGAPAYLYGFIEKPN